MQVFVPLTAPGGRLAATPSLARKVEQAGIDGVSVSEISSDPLQQLTVAAGATERVALISNVTIAFARSPMTLAVAATALQEYSGGRLILGLGTQIKPHIERRFSMPWSAPAARMREYVAALTAIWDSWESGVPVDFSGEFYTHTLMPSEFAPEVSQPRPAVYVAAVGPRMTAAAAAAADGVIVHPFTTDRYFKDVTLAAIAKGAASAGRSQDAVKIAASPLVVTGRTDAEFEQTREAVRSRIAFYGSTSAYKPVLAAHGWEALGDDLYALSKTAGADRWERMTDLVPDEVVQAFAVEGPPDRIGDLLEQRFGGAFELVGVNQGGIKDPELLLDVSSALCRR